MVNLIFPHEVRGSICDGFAIELLSLVVLEKCGSRGFVNSVARILVNALKPLAYGVGSRWNFVMLLDFGVSASSVSVL